MATQALGTDENGNPIPGEWAEKQTRAQIIIPVFIDIEEYEEHTKKENSIEEENLYLQKQVNEKEKGAFRTVIYVIGALKHEFVWNKKNIKSQVKSSLA